MSAWVPVAVGDVARLRKPHPCGGYDWRVTRIGADIGLCCATCGRRILLPREEFERRVRQVEPAPATENTAQGSKEAEDAHPT